MIPLNQRFGVIPEPDHEIAGLKSSKICTEPIHFL